MGGSSSTTTDLPPRIGQHLIKMISNVCFSAFVFAVLILTVIAISYKPPDPWESSRALTRIFTELENATFQTDSSVLRTGEDMALAPADSPPAASAVPITEDLVENSEPKPDNVSFKSGCDDLSQVNCSDPRVLIAIEKFNLRVFRSLVFLDYQTPVNATKPTECDAAWRYRNKKEKSWRKYRDFRRFRIGYGDNCTYKVLSAKGWHSGINARRMMRPNSTRRGSGKPKLSPMIDNNDDGGEINDTIPVLGSESAFSKGRYLYYSQGGDYCKGMNHYLWSFLCALGEAQYLNRTFVMDLSICLSAAYTSDNKNQEGKDFRLYFDFEHLKEVTSIAEVGDFKRDWRKWDKTHKQKIPVRRVSGNNVTPKELLNEKSKIVWRKFDPENYWYRVCEGPAGNYIQRPWHAVWKSKRLTNIVSAISGSMDWDFDSVHVVRGEKARDTEKWPHLDRDTSSEAIVSKIQGVIQPWRNVYVATNEPYYNYFDKLRSYYKVHLLDDYKELWGNNSEWYNETSALLSGGPVEFDGYMRVEVDTEVLYRAKTKVETFYNLTSDCKDGVNTCP